MRWDDVHHQPAALSRLDRALRGGRMPHAYIFAGPEGVGKGMIALRVARRLLCAAAPPACAEWPADACGTCDECTAVAAGAHIDLQIVHRALNQFHPDAAVRKRQATELSVDVIRHFVTDVAARRPGRGRAKIFIIDEAERMNLSAQNALLKTLEEPLGTAFFFLLTNSADRLLPTTRSRCQTITFARLPDTFVRDRLAQQGALSPAAMDYLVGLSDGRAGTALRYAAANLHDIGDMLPAMFDRSTDDPPAFSKAMQEFLKTLDAANVITEAQAGSPGAANRATQSLGIAMLAAVLRDALRIASHRPPATYTTPAPSLQNLATRLGPDGAAKAIRALVAAETDLERSVNTQLVFDTLAIDISRAQRVPAMSSSPR